MDDLFSVELVLPVIVVLFRNIQETCFNVEKKIFILTKGIQGAFSDFLWPEYDLFMMYNCLYDMVPFYHTLDGYH